VRATSKSPSATDPTGEEGHLHATTGHAFIHPTALIDDTVTIGNNVYIGPYVIITGTVTIGDDTKIYAHAVIGTPGQNLGTTTSLGIISIGKKCMIREFVSIHASKNGDG